MPAVLPRPARNSCPPPARGLTASGKACVRIRFWTERELASGDVGRGYPDVMLLDGRGPRHQLRAFGFLDLRRGTKQPCAASYDHTPAFGNVVVIGLEHHHVVPHGGKQFGALGSP